jgi:r-opsin
MEGKLVKMVITVIFVWGFAWTPYAIMAVWGMFFDYTHISQLMSTIPLLFCKISAGVNVMIYGLR